MDLNSNFDITFNLQLICFLLYNLSVFSSDCRYVKYRVFV